MNARSLTLAILAASLSAASTGCRNAPGKPTFDPATARPEQVLDFPTLYRQNCAACHGENGKNGAAISLSNSVYLTMAGFENIRRVTADGLPGSLMPSFGKKAGGMLTDAQLDVLVHGMINNWQQAGPSIGATLPPYAAVLKSDPVAGEKAFIASCASCHGADGSGSKGKGGEPGSLVEPAYLALISDQGLRSIIIAGKPEAGMPDWRSDATGSQGHTLTDQEITDIVAWLASHRTTSPGQPYQQRP